jgi:hypothetical protein
MRLIPSHSSSSPSQVPDSEGGFLSPKIAAERSSAVPAMRTKPSHLASVLPPRLLDKRHHRPPHVPYTPTLVPVPSVTFSPGTNSHKQDTYRCRSLESLCSPRLREKLPSLLTPGSNPWPCHSHPGVVLPQLRLFLCVLAVTVPL